MKATTRAVAYIHIGISLLAFAAALVCGYLLSTGRGKLIVDYLKEVRCYPYWLHGGSYLPLAATALLALVCFFLWTYPWLRLLARQRWAWWALTLWQTIGIMVSLYPFIDPKLASMRSTAVVTFLHHAAVPVLTLFALLIDYPGAGGGRTSRRRKVSRRKSR